MAVVVPVGVVQLNKLAIRNINMFCILIKPKDKTEYELFTNVIFNTEKETLDYVKRSKFNKKIEWKVVYYDMKYFRNEIDKEYK